MSEWAGQLDEEPLRAEAKTDHLTDHLRPGREISSPHPRPTLEREPALERALEPEVSPTTQEPSWQNVLWREWRYTADEAYAQQLFSLVGDLPVSDEVRLVVLGRGVICGVLAGLLLGLTGLLVEVSFWELFWPLGIFIGALLGGAAGAASWWLKRRPTWRHWLGGLTFNLTPGELGLFGVTLGLVGLGSLIGWLLGHLGGLEDTAGFIGMGLLLTGSLGASLVGWLIGPGRQPDPGRLHQYRSFWFWWRQCPRRDEFMLALRQATESSPEARRFWNQVHQALVYGERDHNLDQAVKQLRRSDSLERLIANHLLVTAGGEAVVLLHPVATQLTSSLRQTAMDLLRQIEQETTYHLAHRAAKLLCPRCLARFTRHEVVISASLKISYYGCRACGQSWEFLEGRVLAVLDQNRMVEVEKIESIRINWLVRRKLFDFDAVRIIQATDEEVERFAVQVGNDTDTFRQSSYRQLLCVIAPQCHLSENSRRILGRIFGRVEISQGQLPLDGE